MLRSFFFAGGLFVALWGSSFLMIEEMVLTFDDDLLQNRDSDFRGLFISVDENNRQIFKPPEWAAFSLMSIGSVTMLYSIALPKRN